MVQLYRHFDATGRLLYVGISFSAIARAMQHRSDAEWWLQIARIEIVNYSSRAAALKAERAAIQEERPSYNKAHNDPSSWRHHTVEKVAAHLTDDRVRALRPSQVRVEVPAAPGLGLYLVVQPSGRKTWAYRFRKDGRPCKLTIGRWPKVTAHDAKIAVLSLKMQQEAPHAVGY